MQTSYIYSTSRTNTLSEQLLTQNDIERLLVAAPGEELHTALKETYLASYLLQTNESMAEAISNQLLEAKQVLTQIAPKSAVLDILWVQYDVHNLRIIAKATFAGLNYEQYEAQLSDRGLYAPVYIAEMATSQSLNRLEQDWQETYDEALRVLGANEQTNVDALFDALYFDTIRRKAQLHHDAFMLRYTKTLIDLYNLKSRLRTLSHPDIAFGGAFVSGGNFAQSEIETKEQVLQAYFSLGGEAHWRDAIEFYTSTNNTTQLDARADEYVLTMTREASYNMFSPASLVLYYLRSRQAAANIRTIIVSRDGGMEEETIRPNLRTAYVNQ